MFCHLCVIVDEAAGEDDVPFFPSELFQLQGQAAALFALNEGSGDGIRIRLQCLTDALYVDLISRLNVIPGDIFHGEGEHTPVDHIAAVTLGGKVLAEVGNTAILGCDAHTPSSFMQKDAQNDIRNIAISRGIKLIDEIAIKRVKG